MTVSVISWTNEESSSWHLKISTKYSVYNSYIKLLPESGHEKTGIWVLWLHQQYLIHSCSLFVLFLCWNHAYLLNSLCGIYSVAEHKYENQIIDILVDDK